MVSDKAIAVLLIIAILLSVFSIVVTLSLSISLPQLPTPPKVEPQNKQTASVILEIIPPSKAK